MSEFNFNANQLKEHHNPFKVPEGYFDHFSDKFMATLPNNLAIIHHSWWNRYRYILASAACIVGMVLISTIYVGHFQEQEVQEVAEQHKIDASIDEMADYAMYDNGDMYASLSEY